MWQVAAISYHHTCLAHVTYPLFICTGGVQILVKMLEGGKLSVYLSDLPIAVSLSVHFPVESLLRLGFMEALVEGLKAKVTSGTPAPFVRDSICRAIEALLQKEAISGKP